MVKCNAYFNILNHLGINHGRDKQADRGTEGQILTANSVFKQILCSTMLHGKQHQGILPLLMMSFDDCSNLTCFQSILGIVMSGICIQVASCR